MEGLRKRIIILGAIFVALGAAFIVTSTPRPLRDEPWMEKSLPKKFGAYTMKVGEAGPEHSYKMDEVTYSTLKPYGIVARVMTGKVGDLQTDFDTVVIMSNNKESFHDPRVCFGAQGLILSEERTVIVSTKKHGDIPVTMAKIQQEGRQPSFSAFFYRGPNGFCASTSQVKWQMLMHQIKYMKDAEGAFYRVMPLQSHITEDQLKKFIDDFLTATDEASGGLL